MRRIAALVVAVLAWPLAAGAQSLESQDWQLACDNTRTCRAAGYQRERDVPAVSVLFTRQAGLRAPLFAELRLAALADSPHPGSVRLLVGGKPGPTIALDRDNHAALAGAAVEPLLKALAGNAAIAFTAGKSTWRLSADGAVAVLQKMDEFQGRTGTATALLRRGTLGDDNVLLPLAPPTMRAVRIAAARPGDDELAGRIVAMIPPDDACPLLDDGQARQDPRNAPRLWHLDANRVLVTLACWRRGQASAAGFWIANQRPPFAPRVLTLWGSGFDEASSLWATHNTGAGDCGSTDAWTWNGFEFQPTRSATHGLCRGIADGGAWDLPTLVVDVIPAP